MRIQTPKSNNEKKNFIDKENLPSTRHMQMISARIGMQTSRKCYHKTARLGIFRCIFYINAQFYLATPLSPPKNAN